ncbi:magnesium transporter CorA family protein [Luteolibacter sp. LG18]|uniref:magnesium transporter CorA family protein n=1 Tax=Luteolibacter sp. LG18 TaxID=2819286 RepID=UPI002B2C1DC8|nr:magnesium transporter [Luteolibacter sp. LG18]
MIHHHQFKDGALVPVDDPNASIVVICNPTREEKETILQDYGLDQATLDSILDPDEISRTEIYDEYKLIIWKHADNASAAETIEFNVSSLGILIQGGKTVIIDLDNDPPQFASRDFRGMACQNDLILRLLLHTVRHYLSHLKAIKLLSNSLQNKLTGSMENRYFLQMFSLGEALIYYRNSLESNATVLAQLRGSAGRFGWTEAQREQLGDIIIENQQACKQAEIYSDILSGLMDARGNILNNNMNALLKNLTLINIVFLPLNLIAGIGGMSEFTMMTGGMDWRISYSIFMVAMVVLGIITWRVLHEILVKPRKRKRRVR